MERMRDSNALFRELHADDNVEATEIESLCMNCHQQGITKLLLTRIKHFQDVVISSFSCDHCNWSDRSVQSADSIKEKGVRYTLKVCDSYDLDRQVIKADTATFAIPEVEFEQPPSEKGEITTVEGLISSVVEKLSSLQSERRKIDPDTAGKIDEFIEKLRNLLTLRSPFTLILDDPTGNSYIEKLIPEKSVSVTEYVRSRQQDIMLGIILEDEENEAEENDEPSVSINDERAEPHSEDLTNEVMTISVNCPQCHSLCSSNMKLIDIPFFKQVVIMATVCDACGHRDNEVKGGMGIEEKGKRITLHIVDKSDLNRDLLKSDTCGIRIPELELELEEGTLGGRFTTVEGILIQIKEQLSNRGNLFLGDSSTEEKRQQFEDFLTKLSQIANGERLDVHFILDDPAGNSYLQNLYAPDEDPEMTVEYYERSFSQNETLGLNDMKTEFYS